MSGMVTSTKTVLTTVRGPQRTLDLELPGDVPVERLIALLLDVCAPVYAYGQGSGAPLVWALGPEGEEPLSPTASLVGSGVLDGASLVFCDAASWSSQAAMHSATLDSTAITMPNEDTGGIAIRWNKEGLLS